MDMAANYHEYRPLGRPPIASTEQEPMQNASRCKGKRSRDQEAAEVKAQHRPAMAGDVAPPRVPDRPEHAEKRQRDEQMNPGQAALTDATDEERSHRRHRHQRQIDEPQPAMEPRALA